jgi:hypothetical protein
VLLAFSSTSTTLPTLSPEACGRVAGRQREGKRRAGHKEIGPEHEVVRLGLDAQLSALGLDTLLHAACHAVAHQRRHDEQQALR